MNIGRSEHHQLAALIAAGNISDVEASARTGYSPATISNLRQQREFQKLIDHYAAENNEPVRPDPGERMHNVGLSALEELQQRLEEDPESFSKRELLDMADLLLVKSKALTENRAASGAAPVKLAISFVPAKPIAEEPINILDGVAYTRGQDG
jgi:hypothetical protein